MITQTGIHGKAICGKRAGVPFESVIRPEHNTEECPEGTTPCSLGTSIINTVCYPPSEHEEVCPITQILVVDGDRGEELKSDTNYKVIPYRQEEFSKKFLVYSKTVADNLPITTTAIGQPDTFDKRFIEIGESMTVLESQQDSGVLEELSEEE